jgi:hypothetical protein
VELPLSIIWSLAVCLSISRNEGSPDRDPTPANTLDSYFMLPSPLPGL